MGAPANIVVAPNASRQCRTTMHARIDRAWSEQNIAIVLKTLSLELRPITNQDALGIKMVHNLLLSIQNQFIRSYNLLDCTSLGYTAIMVESFHPTLCKYICLGFRILDSSSDICKWIWGSFCRFPYMNFQKGYYICLWTITYPHELDSA